jgi:hypothetical protein
MQGMQGIMQGIMAGSWRVHDPVSSPQLFARLQELQRQVQLRRRKTATIAVGSEPPLEHMVLRLDYLQPQMPSEED